VTGASATSLSSIFALSAEAERAALVVSIHDVAPSTQTRVAEIISDLAHRGAAVTSLLVVPNYHRRGRSTDDRGFVRWLQDLEAKGHEIVIHGYFHERPRRDGVQSPDDGPPYAAVRWFVHSRQAAATSSPQRRGPTG
jgi:predicted deacetylase